MSTNWIKIEHWTPDKPEIFEMADTLGIDADSVLGKLIRIWIWADSQTQNGNAPRVTFSLLDRVASVAGFAQAMFNVGWIAKNESGISFSNFDRHNGETAKTRANSAKRTAKHRASVTKPSQECNAERVTSPLLVKKSKDTLVSLEESASDIDQRSLTAQLEKKTKTKKRGEVPTVEEVAEYCKSAKLVIDAEYFCDYNQARGWKFKTGKPIVDWKATARYWNRTEIQKQEASKPASCKPIDFSDPTWRDRRPA